MLGLKATVGDGRVNRSEDVKTVQRGMTALGRYAEHDEPNGSLDKPLHDAVTGYQRDRGLKADGWLKPGGETAGQMASDLSLLRASSEEDDDEDALSWGTLWKRPRAAGNALGDAAGNAVWWKQRGIQAGFGTLGTLSKRLTGDDRGFGRASDYLGHYLGASGTPRKLTPKEVDGIPAIRAAKDRNRLLLESNVTLGKTADRYFNEKLHTFADGGDTKLRHVVERPSPLSAYATRPGDYLTFGNSGVRSEIDMDVRRRRSLMYIDGKVTHRLDRKPQKLVGEADVADPYDFNPGQPGSLSAAILEPQGKASPFDMQSERRQSFRARVRLTPKRPRVLEEITWSDIE